MRDTGMRPIRVMGLGGTLRPGSSTETAIRTILRHAEEAGAETTMFGGAAVNFPPYEQDKIIDSTELDAYLTAVRGADAFVIGSPGYHGGISGLIKNALDYIEETSRDAVVYLDGRAVGCVATGSGSQGAVMTMNALRGVVHALRGWPSPLGIALNTREPLFDRNGECLRSDIGEQFRIMAHQIVDFAISRRHHAERLYPEGGFRPADKDRELSQ